MQHIHVDSKIEAEILDEISQASKDLLKAMSEIADDLARSKQNINEGCAVNSLGILQSSGVKLDILCGVRQKLIQLALVAGYNDVHIAKASTGDRSVRFTNLDI